MIFNTGLTHLGSEASKIQMQTYAFILEIFGKCEQFINCRTKGFFIYVPFQKPLKTFFNIIFYYSNIHDKISGMNTVFINKLYIFYFLFKNFQKGFFCNKTYKKPFQSVKKTFSFFGILLKYS